MEIDTTLSASISAAGLQAAYDASCKRLLSENTLPVEKKRVLRDEYGIPMTVKLEKEVSFMCNLSDGVWNKGVAQGHRKTVLSDLRSLMQNTGWTVEKCMDILNVPLENRREYAYELNKQ